MPASLRPYLAAFVTTPRPSRGDRWRLALLAWGLLGATAAVCGALRRDAWHSALPGALALSTAHLLTFGCMGPWLRRLSQAYALPTDASLQCNLSCLLCGPLWLGGLIGPLPLCRALPAGWTGALVLGRAVLSSSGVLLAYAGLAAHLGRRPPAGWALLVGGGFATVHALLYAAAGALVVLSGSLG